MAEFDNKTCARLEVQEELHDSSVKKTLFVESVWEPTSSSPTSSSPTSSSPTSSSPTSFSLAVSDGYQTWTFEGSEAFLNERADMWDKNVSWVMEKLKFYLSVGQSGVTYYFTKTRDIHRKLSFEIQDRDANLSLTANLLMLSASSQNVTSNMLDFLLHGNEKLTVEFLEKCRSFDQMEAKNRALLEKVEHLKNEKFLFQQDIFPKQKRKLRELKEKVQRMEQLKAVGSNKKNCTTSNSSGDDDDVDEELDQQRSLLVKRAKDPDTTKPCLDE